MNKDKFVIGIYVPGYIEMTRGGAFSYTELLTDELLKTKDEELVFRIVLEGQKETHSSETVIIDYRNINYSFKQKMLLKLGALTWLKGLRKKSQSLVEKYKERFIVKTLNEARIDIMYYPSQHEALTENFPFVVNNWDLAHITIPPLPDTMDDIGIRQNWYRTIVPKAMSIFVESETGKTEVEHFLNIHKNRIKVLPIFPGKVIDLKVSAEEQANILSKWNLSSDNYFFYPAQFWALKNHYHLLYAFQKLDLKNKPNLKLVFCGSDKENQDYIKQIIVKLDLQNEVLILGFVDYEELYTLYKNCTALVFPSLLGPTNMPILEAMALGKPVLCSNLKGHKEMLPDFDGLFDPLSPESISSSMQKFLDNSDFRRHIIQQIATIHKNSIFNKQSALKIILQHFKEIKNYRRLWK